MWLYYKLLLAEAWKDFAIATGEQVIGALLAVAILAFQIYLGVVHPADVRASWWAIVWPYLLLVMGLFLWHLIRAPWKLSLRPVDHPKANLKEQILKLSSSILEFVYARRGEQPKNAIAPRFALNTDGSGDWVREMQEYSHVAQERTDYESNTLGIYNSRFKRDVVKAIESLKRRGLDCTRIETCMTNLADEGDPLLAGIKIPSTSEIEEAGKQLEYLADQLRNS